MLSDRSIKVNAFINDRINEFKEKLRQQEKRKIICDEYRNECPCLNIDNEQGGSCNLGYEIEYKEFNKKWNTVSDNCGLMGIVHKDGMFQPKEDNA